MKLIALDSKPEEPLTNDSRVRAGRLAPATPSPVACSAFTYCVLSDQFNEFVGAMTCTAPSCTSIDHCNQQYSIYALSDSSGNVSERYAYTAYGQPTFLNASATVQTSSAAGNRYTYTAREWDQTIGLSHFRARWMSGLSGRFLSRDPIRFKAGANFYRLAIALTLTDAMGLTPTKLTECQREKGRYEAEVKSTCGKTNFSIICVDNCKNDASGFTGCKSNSGRKSIKITVCTNTTANVISTLEHEVQHAKDYCGCKDCSLGENEVDESRKDYCEDRLCLEVRALIAGNDCGFAVGDDAKKRCLKGFLDWYKGDYKCQEADINAVIERCYVPVGDTMPTYPYRERYTPFTPEDIRDFVNDYCNKACAKKMVNDFPDGSQPPTEEFYKCVSECVSLKCSGTRENATYTLELQYDSIVNSSWQLIRLCVLKLSGDFAE